MRADSKLLFSAVVLGLIAGCGSLDKADDKDSADEDETVEVPLDITLDEEAAGLSLLATTATYAGNVAGCISSQADTFTNTTPTVTALIGDTGCYARLTSITATFSDGSSSTYAPDPAYKFVAGTSLIVNPSTVATTRRIMKISVTSNLPTTAITGAPLPTITMALSFLESEAGTVAVSAVNAGINVSVANVIPFQLATSTVTVDGTTGGGAFVLNLNCYSVVGGDGKCDGLSVTGLAGALDIDSFETTGGVDRDLTEAECNGLVTGPKRKLPTTVYTQGAANKPAVLTNGGAVFNITGPATLCQAANTDLIFATAITGTTSCKYFRITVGCP